MRQGINAVYSEKERGKDHGAEKGSDHLPGRTGKAIPDNERNGNRVYVAIPLNYPMKLNNRCVKYGC